MAIGCFQSVSLGSTSISIGTSGGLAAGRDVTNSSPSPAQVSFGAVSNYDEVYIAEDYPKNGLERFAGGGSGQNFGVGGGVAGANGVAVDGSGGAYVSGYADNRIWKYGRDGTGSLLATATNAGAVLQGLACDGQGNIYAGDLNGEVLKFNSSGIETVCGSLGVGESSTGVALDGAGKVWVASASDGRIFTLGTNGVAALFYQLPAKLIYGLALDGAGNVYAADYGAGAVWEVAADGSHAWEMATNLAGPVGLAFDRSGNLLISEYDASDVVAVRPDGTVTAYALTSSGPDFLAVRAVAALIAAKPYTGAPQSLMAVTDPPGLAVTVTYDGLAQAPASVGSYIVVGTITDPGYAGSVTNELTIVPAVPVITNLPVAGGIMYGQNVGASGLSGGAANTPGSFAFVDGSILPLAGVTNVAVIFTPFDTNDYTVVLTNVDVVVAGIPAAVTLSNLTQFYTGSGARVSASTDPAGLTVGVTYNGNPQPPTNAGEYEVVGAIRDSMYGGSVTNELLVLPLTPVIAPLPVASAIASGQPLSAAVLSGGAAGTPGNFAFADGTQVLPPGTTNVVVVFTPADTNNYDIVSTLVTLVVQGSPTGANGRALVNPGQSHAFATTDWGFADPFNQPPNHFAQVEILTLPAVGSLAFNGTAVALGQWVDVSGGLVYTPSLDVSGPAYATLTFLVADDGLPGANVSMATNTFTFDAGQPSAPQLKSSFTPSVYGNELFFTVTNLAADAGGSVIFATNGAAFSTNNVAGGVAVSGLAANLPAGTNVITAVYSGDVNYLAAETDLVQVVTPAVPEIAVVPRAGGISAGQTLAASLLRGGVANTAGLFTFADPTIQPLAGLTNVSILFTPADTNDYFMVSTNIDVTVGLAAAVVSLGVTSNYDRVYVAEDYPTNGLELFPGGGGGGVRFGVGLNVAGANGVAIDSTGNVYVAGYSDNKIWKQSPVGVALPFATATNAGASLQGLACDGSGNIYAGDLGRDVLKFNPAGVETVLCHLGTADITTGVALDRAGNVLVASETSGKIFVVGTNGAAVVFYQLPAGILYGLAVDGAGNVYAADYGAGSVWKVAYDGGGASLFATNLAGPVGLAFDHLGNLLVSEYDGRAIVSVAPDGAVSAFATTGASGPNFLSVQTVAQLMPARVYNGGPQTVAATTVPPGLAVAVTYGGSPQAPTNAGSYTVIGTVVDGQYSGSITNTLVVVPAVPVISKVPVASAIEYGQTIGTSVLSGGVVDAPGSFAFTDGTIQPLPGVTNVGVIFTPVDTNDYTTAATAVSVAVTGLPAVITLTNLVQYYTGVATPATVTTSPAGLAVAVTYNGNFSVPTNAGIYQVVTTILDPLYTGAVTNELDILPATPVISILPDASEIADGQTLAASVLTGGNAGTAGSFTFVDPTLAPWPSVTNVAVVFTPFDTNNYTLAFTVMPVVVLGTPPSSPAFGQIIGIFNPSGGTASVSFLGHPGYPYSLQRSTNLVTWDTITTTNVPPTGRVDFSDAYDDLGGVSPDSAYYRLMWLP